MRLDSVVVLLGGIVVGYWCYQSNKCDQVNSLLAGTPTAQKCQEAFNISKGIWMTEYGIHSLLSVTGTCHSLLSIDELESAADARALEDPKHRFPLLEVAYLNLIDAHLAQGNCEKAKQIVFKMPRREFSGNAQISSIIEKCPSLTFEDQEQLADKMSRDYENREDIKTRNKAYARIAERLAAQNECSSAYRIAEKIVLDQQPDEALYEKTLQAASECFKKQQKEHPAEHTNNVAVPVHLSVSLPKPRMINSSRQHR